MPENVCTKDLAHEKNTKSPEGAAAGGGAGLVLGGTLGWLAEIGALAMPGLGPFIAAGPIMAALAGVGVGTAVGGIAGGLICYGYPGIRGQRYEGRIRNGGILLSVNNDNSQWTRKAKNILESAGAQEISSTGESRADFAKSDKPLPRTGTGG